MENINGQTFDVVVIGGGIIGASTAREVAAEGYSVLLVEKDDFASGATSRSSRLLHCGLRYFEAPKPVRTFMMHPSRLLNALKMSKQAMKARYEVVKSVPQRVNSINFILPIYSDDDFKPWQIDLGFSVLSRFTPDDVPLDYQRIGKSEALSNPLIASLSNKDKLIGAAKFTEYQFNWPERLCVDAVMDAKRLGAVTLNYTVAKIKDASGGERTIELKGHGGKTAQVKASRVMVMAGAWIDRVLSDVESTMPRKSTGTKGAHIVVKLPEACRGQGITKLNSQGEPFYCIPWSDYHYIGPTETLYEGNPDEVHADSDDVRFLLEETASLFPGLKITHEDIVSTWAGVRPLTFDENQPKGARNKVLHDLSRHGLSGVYALTAGPIMSHRDTGREVVTKLLQEIEPHGQKTSLEYASEFSLNYADNFYSEFSEESIKKAVKDEDARTIFDVIYRRLGIGWDYDALPELDVDHVSRIMARELHWTEVDRKSEVETFLRESKRLFDVPDI